jgi:CPA2 family monovalent cation:H+ antiporter-2
MWQPWHTHTVLEDLVVVLCTAAITTVMFRRLRQPVLLGYLLAGLLVGPHVSLLPVVADSGRVAAISELGVILVMFGIGMEFSLRRLGAVLPTAGVAAVTQIGLMLWLGYLVGQGLGWPVMDSVFLGAAVCISSTMVVARVFGEEGITGKRTELVFGILIIEDLAAVMLMAVLTALASGAAQTGALVAVTAGRLLAFLAGLVVIGFLLVPRMIRGVAALRSPCSWPAWACASRSRCWRTPSATRSRSAPSWPARSWPSRAASTRSGGSWARCATCSPRSSSSPSA